MGTLLRPPGFRLRQGSSDKTLDRSKGKPYFAVPASKGKRSLVAISAGIPVGPEAQPYRLPERW